MHRRSMLSICFLLLVASANNAAAEDAQNAQNTDVVVRQEKNVVFAEVHGIGLMMDVFTPTGKKNGLALIDVVSGSWDSSRGKLRDHERAQVFDIMCGRGYTVFAVRPGSLSKFSIPEMVTHIEIAIGWVKERADDYGIAADRLGLMGASAGGHLASLVAVGNQQDTERGEQTAVHAVGVFFPPTDLLEYGGRAVDPSADDGVAALVRRIAFPQGTGDLTDEQLRRRLEQISPARRVTEHTPPFLLIHGTADMLVPIEQSRKMQAALQAKGVPAKLIVKQQGGHPWPTIHEEVAVMADWFDDQLHTAQAE